MDSLFDSIEEWFREILISGIMQNLGNTFDSVNAQVGQIATEVAQTPSNFLRVYSVWYEICLRLSSCRLRGLS